MHNYHNRTVFIFDGVETDRNTGKETVVNRTTIHSEADCWPELFSRFVMGLRGAGYYPNKEGFMEVLDEMFEESDLEHDGDPDYSEDEYDEDDDTETVMECCCNCEHNRANYPA